MKKVAAFTLMLLMTLLSVTVAYAVYRPGDTVTVAFHIVSETGIAATGSVNYDKSVFSYVSASASGNAMSPNATRFGALNMGGCGLDGTVTYTFAIKDGALPGSYSITASLIQCGDKYEQETEATISGGVTVTVIDINCIHENMMLISGKEPTCNIDGLSDGVQCTACFVMVEEQMVLPALGHVIDDAEAYAPTCTANGLGPMGTCERCGYVQDEREVLPALGHDVHEEVTVNATCLEAGAACMKCQRCGWIESAYELPSLGHDLQPMEELEPTCTEDGLTGGIHCVRCGEVEEAQTVVTALGHNAEMNAGYAPTCTEPGAGRFAQCKRCGKALTKPEEIPPTGHIITCMNKLQEMTVGDSACLTIRFYCGDASSAAVDWYYDEAQTTLTQDHIAPSDKYLWDTIFQMKQAGIVRIHPQIANCSTEDEFMVIVHSDDQLILPAELREIGKESFVGIRAEEVVLPQYLQSIGSRAFADNEQLMLVLIPESVVFIADDAFEGCHSLTFLLNGNNAYAKEYAIKHEISYLSY